MPGMSSENAVAHPTRIISPVTPFAEMDVFSSIQVRYGETSRRYSDAVQCSALARERTSGGCETSRSCAIEVGRAVPPTDDVNCHLPVCAVMLRVSFRNPRMKPDPHPKCMQGRTTRYHAAVRMPWVLSTGTVAASTNSA